MNHKEELKQNKALIKCECSTNPFDSDDCVYSKPMIGAQGHTRCKYWQKGECTSICAMVNIMTRKLKEVGL